MGLSSSRPCLRQDGDYSGLAEKERYSSAYRRLCLRSPGILDIQAWDRFVLTPLIDAGMPLELSHRLFTACDVKSHNHLGLDDLLCGLTVITMGRHEERAVLVYHCIAGIKDDLVRSESCGSNLFNH